MSYHEKKIKYPGKNILKHATKYRADNASAQPNRPTKRKGMIVSVMNLT